MQTRLYKHTSTRQGYQSRPRNARVFVRLRGPYTRFMRRFFPALGNIGAIVLIALPIGLAAVLNQTLRPFLADQLGGTAHTNAGWSRGNYVASNQWWEFDSATQLNHPVLTTYLEREDGFYLAIGGVCSVCIAAVVFWLTARSTRTRTRTRTGTGS
jgi:uncharacterized protein YggT (Ycf19 family)